MCINNSAADSKNKRCDNALIIEHHQKGRKDVKDELSIGDQYEVYCYMVCFPVIRKDMWISDTFCSYWKAGRRLNQEVDEAEWYELLFNIWGSAVHQKKKKSCSCLPKRDCILRSSDLRSIDCQLYYRSLMKCSAKKVYLILELLAGMGKWLLQSYTFCRFSWCLSKSVLKNWRKDREDLIVWEASKNAFEFSAS